MVIFREATLFANATPDCTPLSEAAKTLFTLRLNTILYPEEARTLKSFPKALLRKGDMLLARQYLEKAERYAGH